MYENLKKKRIGGFSDGAYWSSSKTEAAGRSVWQIIFSDGRHQGARVGSSLRGTGDADGLVRAVRRF